MHNRAAHLIFSSTLTHTQPDDDSDSDSDDESQNKTAKERLAKCLPFRRFIAVKSLLLMSGTADVVKAGARFGSLMHSPAMDERSADTMRIASSFLLGPLLLAEFVKSVYRLERTSLAPQGGGSGQQSPGTVPFAQLCMRAFASCVRGIMTDGPHGMSKAKRVQTLISCAVGKARSVAPQSGDGFDYFNGRTPARPHGAPEDEMQLARALVPFVSPGVVSEATTCDDASTRLSVLAELLANGMHREADEVCHLVSIAAGAFTDANLRERHGVYLLRAWESGEGRRVGVLGVDHACDDEEGSSPGLDETCALTAFDLAIRLGSGLSGGSPVPLPPGLPCDGVARGRYAMGLPMSDEESWPPKARGRIKRLLAQGGMVCAPLQLAWALSLAVGVGDSFVGTLGDNSGTKKEMKLQITRNLVKSSTFDKEKSAIGALLSSAIDDALNEAEFIVKSIPNIEGDALDLAQRFASGLLLAASEMIGASSLGSESVGENGSFVSLLLKNTKRVYMIVTKLILSFMRNPESLTSDETKQFLDSMTNYLIPKVSAVSPLSCLFSCFLGRFLSGLPAHTHHLYSLPDAHGPPGGSGERRQGQVPRRKQDRILRKSVVCPCIREGET